MLEGEHDWAPVRQNDQREGVPAHMTLSSVTIQIAPQSRPSTPSWMGEVAVFAQVLTHEGVLKAVAEKVRFARARFGHYDVIDFVAVLIGYAVSGESTLLAFYERLAPFTEPFMALFGRNQLPHRSTLSRFLAALDQASVEALRMLFQEDLLARKPFAFPGGLFDRMEALACRRCGWNETSRPPTSAAADRHLACSSSSV